MYFWQEFLAGTINATNTRVIQLERAQKVEKTNILVGKNIEFRQLYSNYYEISTF